MMNKNVIEDLCQVDIWILQNLSYEHINHRQIQHLALIDDYKITRIGPKKTISISIYTAIVYML